MHTLRSVFDTILDAIMPLKERSARTKERALEDLPLSPTVHDLLGTRITTLMDYRETAVEDLVRALKYDGSTHAAHLAAAIIADYLREEIASHRRFSQKPVLLMPIPLHRTRIHTRGFNQIELALGALPKELRDGTLAHLSNDILVRERATKPQTRLPRSERLSNVAGAFTLTAPEVVRGAYVYVFDDVATTGATLANAATPLRRAGAEVSLIALAHA